MKRAALAVAALALVAALGIAGYFVIGWTADGPGREDKALIVPQGATLTAAAAKLEQAGAIGSARAFLLRARVFGSDDPVRAGEYLIPRGASGAEILRLLQEGDVIRRLVTIPEGMPAVLVQEKLAAEKTLTGPAPLPAEGSVLPDSYAFERGETRAAVLARMQKAMDAVLAAAWAKRSPDTVVKTPREAVILASIVEKETAKPAERPMVAAVYTNRLKAGMMLQADPTIIYPITRGKPLGRRIRRSEIEARNDYNTYAMAGLPKGPIANPGKASIEAVLHPARSRALYFVADGTGGHIFADTLAEHNDNVRKWFEIRRQRGEM